MSHSRISPRYLPCRQFRKQRFYSAGARRGYLPCRQFRKIRTLHLFFLWVICRVGSLEIINTLDDAGQYVICRVGSLETQEKLFLWPLKRYLPCRQFRKYCRLNELCSAGYLPCRQFRKQGIYETLQRISYLPCRQFICMTVCL